jgi:hypothetical protein
MCSDARYKRNVRFWLKDNSAAFHLTNSYCIVDSVIRVIRNLTGANFSDRNVFFDTVKIYNNTVHKAFNNKFTPLQVQSDFELENEYIRMKEEQLNKANNQQIIKGLRGYAPGNILLVHVPWRKTRLQFKKQRRNFSVLASFLRYEGGNAVVSLLKPIKLHFSGEDQNIVIPIFYTKLVANSINELDQKYRIEELGFVV